MFFSLEIRTTILVIYSYRSTLGGNHWIDEKIDLTKLFIQEIIVWTFCVVISSCITIYSMKLNIKYA